MKSCSVCAKPIRMESTKCRSHSQQGLTKIRVKQLEPQAIINLSNAKTGSKNPMWKGGDVKYGSLHDWVKWHKPKSLICEICKESKKLDLANISGSYKRDLSDWEWLCRRCHMMKDGRIEKLIERHRSKKDVQEENKNRVLP